MSVAFLLTALIIVATPGTGVLYTLAAGLSRGARASIIAAIGCTLGIVPPMVAAITGLAALLHTSALAFQTLKYVGVAYLLYMAWRRFHWDVLRCGMLWPDDGREGERHAVSTVRGEPIHEGRARSGWPTDLPVRDLRAASHRPLHLSLPRLSLPR